MTKLVEVIPSSFASLPKRRMPTLRVLLATGAAVAFLASLASPAEAQHRYRYYSPYNGFTNMFGTFAPRRATRSAVPSHKREPEKDLGFGELPKGPLQIVVSIDSQRVALFANGERVAEGPVSTGVPGHPTPLGVFSVIQKDRHHRSNIYSGAPMPFMQRITWSGIALHEGALPGHPASHGCIRLSYDFARKLWPTTKLGARVIVARTELAPSRLHACQAVRAATEAGGSTRWRSSIVRSGWRRTRARPRRTHSRVSPMRHRRLRSKRSARWKP